MAEAADGAVPFEAVAALIVPGLADLCRIDVLQADGALAPAALVGAADGCGGPGPRLRCLPDLLRWEPVARAVRTGRAELIPQTGEAHAVVGERAARLGGPQSCLIVPVRTGTRVHGVLTLLAMGAERYFGSEDRLVAEDVAGRVALALDNARLRHEAAEALHLRDQFLSVVAHELKTPVTAMLASVQLLQRRAARTPDGEGRDRRALSVLNEQTRRLHRLIVSLLDLSRLQTGQFVLTFAPVDLHVLVPRLAEELQGALDRHVITLRCPDTPLWVTGDDLLLEQVIQNLLQNAIKYSPQGGAVELACEASGDEVRLAVTDHGIGIPPEALPRLFKRFYRAPNVDARQIGGMGLGLYIVQEIVELHHGRIEVASVPGEGSTFTVYLPTTRRGDGSEG